MLRWIIVMSLLSALLTPVFGKSRPYTVLEHTHAVTAILVNPKAYRFHVYHVTPPFDDHVLSFNANYYDPATGYTIGLLGCEGKWHPTMLVDTALRSCIVLRNGKFFLEDPRSIHRPAELMLQAGPTLLRKGVCQLPQSIHREKFQADAVRTCPHITLGITKAGKLVVLYSRDLNLYEITRHLVRLGVTDALKMDGGHSAHLWFTPDKNDTQSPEVRRGTALVHCGVYLTRKT